LKWPDGCIEILAEEGIDSRQIRHYLRWLREFFDEYRGKKREELGRKEIETYLSKLISKPNIKALQVGPARQHTSRTVFLHCSG